MTTPPMATVDSPEGLSLRSPKGRIALIATIAASGMTSLDATVVNVALPHIGMDLDAGVSALQWVLTGYLVSLASLILLGGALGDRLGRRKVFVIGTISFAGASLLCGLAPNVTVLVVARILQGVGGALLTPGSLAILQASFRASDRSAAIGAWSGLGGAAAAIGPFVGGGLVDGPGWRWAFLLNVPVAAVAVVCAYSAVPETRDPRAPHRLDLAGSALAVIALGTTSWALTEAGSRGWTNGAVLGAGAVAVVAAGVFLRRTLHIQDPLVPPALFRNPIFTIVNLTTVPLYAAIGVSFFLIAYELQVAAGWSATEAGVALLPATALMLVLSSASGSLAQRIGPRLQLTAGPLLVGAGLLSLTRIGTGTSWATDVLPGAIVFGLGLVTVVAPLTATVMAATDPNHVSVGSAVNNAVARAASLTALAVIPVVSGLSVATSTTEVTHSFRVALVISGCVAAAAAPLANIGLRNQASVPMTPRRLHCAIDGTPLQPDLKQSVSVT